MNYATVSFLNLLCYVLLGASRYLGLMQLMHFALLTAVASLYFTVRMLLYYLHHKAETPQGTLFRICFSFVCIVFSLVIYVMDTILPGQA